MYNCLQFDDGNEIEKLMKTKWSWLTSDLDFLIKENSENLLWAFLNGCDNFLQLRPRPHCAGGIWKRSFISRVGPSVQSNPEKLSTENGAFRTRSWKRRNLKTELCVLVWTENILKTKLFENDDVTIIAWSTWPSLHQIQIQNGGRNGDCHVDFATWVQLKPCNAHAHGCTQVSPPPVIVAFSDFPAVVWTGKHFIRFLVWKKTFDAFSEWNLRFQIPPA